MWRHIDAWRKAASELGVEISGPLQIFVQPNDPIQADVLFHCFGAEKGMLVVPDYYFKPQHPEQLFAAGYGLSLFMPPQEGFEYSKDALADMLAEWGWCGPVEQRPSWLQSHVETK